MIRLHCTQKLLTKLPMDASNRLKRKTPPSYAPYNETESPLSGWHANLLTIQRRNCVLFVHDATRFPVLATSLTKPEFADLDFWFQDVLMNTLLKCGANERQMEIATTALAPIACDTNCDRSVQGTLNRMKQDLEHLIWYDNLQITELPPYQTGAWLADGPCTIKGSKEHIWPAKAMLAFLNHLATLNHIATK